MGKFGNVAKRRVNTIFDKDIAPWSNMVLGEVLNDRGNWSGYLPHRHPQPECYYFKFDRPEGFGASFVGDQVFKSVDNSFGFSLQTGVMHANRAGDIDPYIVPFLMSKGMELDDILHGLSKNGGLLGVSGVSNDLREVSAAAADGNARAELAINMFVCSIVRFIGAYYAELGGLDQLVFTGGIGENSDLVRSRVCAQIRHLGVELDEEKNSGCREGTISSAASAVRVSVIPANEELGVARQTYGYIEKMEG